MYYMLTTRELAILQDILYEGTEQAFQVANRDGVNLDLVRKYRASHREVATIFIEVATELVGRLDNKTHAA
jgi:transcription elongation factor